MRYIILLITACSLLIASCGSEEDSASNTADTSNTAQKDSKGKQLFNNYCIQCHGLDNAKIGPALSGALAKWNNDTSRIAAFIKNSADVIAAGDPRAVEVAKEWNYAMMTPMPFLSDEDINELLDYMAQGSK